MKSTLAALFIFAFASSGLLTYASDFMGFDIFAGASHIEGDYVVDGRMAISGPTDVNNDYPVALLVEPQTPASGVFSIADRIAVFGYSETDTGILGSSESGYGVQAVSNNGTALFISGKVEKENRAADTLVIYDAETNQELGRFRYAFE